MLEYFIVTVIIVWSLYMVYRRIASRRGCCSDSCLCDSIGKRRHQKVMLKR